MAVTKLPDKFMTVTKLPDKFMAVTKGICLEKFKSIETSMAVFSQGTVSTAGCLVSYRCQWL